VGSLATPARHPRRFILLQIIIVLLLSSHRHINKIFFVRGIFLFHLSLSLLLFSPSQQHLIFSYKNLFVFLIISLSLPAPT